MNKVSVIIPNYNGCNFLEECIKSVLSQTIVPDEIIVSDDASTDQSVKILKELAAKYSVIKLLERKKNVGLAVNKHEAVMASSSKYVTFLDSDDFYINHKKIENELTLLDHYVSKGLDNVITYSQVAIVDECGSVIKVNGLTNAAEGDIFFDILTRGLSFVPRDFMLTKEQYLRSGGFDLDTKLYVDWNLKLKLAENNLFFCTHDLGVAYRKHGFGMSSASKLLHTKWMIHGFSNNVGKLSFQEKIRAYPIFYSKITKMILGDKIPLFARRYIKSFLENEKSN